ncbi:sugar ABC transporter ATP-binding protein [Streptomyces luteolifulvus]|uniref:Sugar ABC transporter ATP-binding protein n=1 Tax=Streptomyces luteolifulvus TaxID=2615112 RepID=A0A6H9UR60_9ACTN|nr:sugar ABC transporter ATP-binding protein [Streptomyces luteolifulvus]KAB1140110.1 sugar ABC transporter ATP-binding protein [Streptomyces luteolifulvus]
MGISDSQGPRTADLPGAPAHTSASQDRRSAARVLLRVHGLSKSFAGTKALDGVGFEVNAGDVVSVVGQNGSGKSTLVKVLAGIHTPDPGAVIEHRDIRFIHQDLGLVPGLSTIENLDIARPLGRRGFWPAKSREELLAAERMIRRFGGDFDVTEPIARITAAERTLVAIARAMSDWSPTGNVLVLDEPTAALGAAESELLFDAVRTVAAEGAGVVFISHRLDEVLGLSDRVVALRDGRLVADVPAGEVDHDRLVDLIAGSELAEFRMEHADERGRPMLRARGLVTDVLRGVDLDIHEGEVVGVCGLLGSGREHLAAVLFGAMERHAGTVTAFERPLKAADPARSIRHGLAYVPADRLRQGAVMTMTATENLTLPWLRPLRSAFGSLDRAAERGEARAWTDRVALRPPQPDRPLRLFSGGNQQKIVMAKWLRMAPAVLLLDEPTQGVDIAAKAAIHQLIAEARAAGTGVLVSSTDTREILDLCDRVLILRDGRVSAELSRHELSEARLISESLGLSTTSAPSDPHD